MEKTPPVSPSQANPAAKTQVQHPRPLAERLELCEWLSIIADDFRTVHFHEPRAQSLMEFV